MAGGLGEVERSQPDLVVLDLGLPDCDGLELVRRVRGLDRLGQTTDPQMPILVLSGRGSELDRLRGFAAECDDYVLKPFSYQELRARIDALLRRVRLRAGVRRVTVGPLIVDAVSREAFLRGETVTLSNKEFDLLAALARDPHRPCTRAELLHDVWGLPRGLDSRTLDAHAYRLRRKLARHGDRFVINVYGLGYRLADGRAE
jgi:DNA-binding response OmpR family regulator